MKIISSLGWLCFQNEEGGSDDYSPLKSFECRWDQKRMFCTSGLGRREKYLFLFICFPDEKGENHYPSAHCFAEKGLNLFQAGEPFYPRRLIDILVNGTFTTYSVHLVQLGTYNSDGKLNVWKILKWTFSRCFSDKTLSSRLWNILLNFEFLMFPQNKNFWMIIDLAA